MINKSVDVFTVKCDMHSSEILQKQEEKEYENSFKKIPYTRSEKLHNCKYSPKINFVHHPIPKYIYDTSLLITPNG